MECTWIETAISQNRLRRSEQEAMSLFELVLVMSAQVLSNESMPRPNIELRADGLGKFLI